MANIQCPAMSEEAQSIFRDLLSSLNRIHEIMSDPDSDDYFSANIINAELTQSIEAGETFLNSLLPKLPKETSTSIPPCPFTTAPSSST